MEHLEKKIEGVGVIYDDGRFEFDSGLPLLEPVLEFEVKPHRGVMSVVKNGCAAFEPLGKPVALPPVMDLVLRDKNLIVRRTSRNFVVQMKFPIIEAGEVTNKAHSGMWKRVCSALRAEREKIKEEF